MPIYEFKCRECGKVSELRIPMHSESKNAVCQHCGSHEMEKLMSVPSLVGGKGESGETRCCGRNEPCSHQQHCCEH
jgi:putative FmdB family regulatory protein